MSKRLDDSLLVRANLRNSAADALIASEIYVESSTECSRGHTQSSVCLTGRYQDRALSLCHLNITTNLDLKYFK